MRSTRTLLLALTVAVSLGSSLGLAEGATVPGRSASGSASQAATADAVVAKRATVVKWPGHRPGKMYLGMSCGGTCAEKERELGQSIGVHRQFEGWDHWGGLADDIQADHAANRLPWLSFKGPLPGAAGWRAIANGDYDAKLRDLATMLKANDDKPVLLTFHHEPSNDGTEAEGALWAAAYCHIHDLLRFNGALANVADPPIVGDWLFNPRNKGQVPANWVTDAVLQRAPFLGIDMYENAGGDTFGTRLPAIKAWMAAQGFPGKMIGIGETGSTDGYSHSTAVRWMDDSLSWAANHPNAVGVVSYFNSQANSRDGVYWPLDESTLKMSKFRSLLDHANVVS